MEGGGKHAGDRGVGAHTHMHTDQGNTDEGERARAGHRRTTLTLGKSQPPGHGGAGHPYISSM